MSGRVVFVGVSCLRLSSLLCVVWRTTIERLTDRQLEFDQYRKSKNLVFDFDRYEIKSWNPVMVF